MDLAQLVSPTGQLQLPPQMALPDVIEAKYAETTAEGSGQIPQFTFLTYTDNPQGDREVYTRDTFITKVRALAARLQQVGERGDRVAILAPNSMAYVIGFFGTIHAGQVAVPLYDPAEPGHAHHLAGVLADCTPKTILTTTQGAKAVRALFADKAAAERPRIIVVEGIADSLAEQYQRPADMLGTEVAYLQYTSGSTRIPAGVKITHHNVIANLVQILIGVHLAPPLRAVSWLPMYHDMGIIVLCLGAVGRIPFSLMTPRDFVQRPSRWLVESSKAAGDIETLTVLPNFAFEHVARFAADMDGKVDLSNVSLIINGSEPVTRASMEAFMNAFPNSGLHPHVIRPSYGLAEATLLVATTGKEGPVASRIVDREKLNAGEIVLIDPAEQPDVVTTEIWSCGPAAGPQALAVVAVDEDAKTGVELPDGQIGELWVAGAHIAQGYYNNEKDTAATFGFTLRERLPEGSHAALAPEDSEWLATGDNAVFIDGEIYITGRVKDLVIIGGRNHYPQDIEMTAFLATDHIRRGMGAAFSVAAEELSAEQRSRIGIGEEVTGEQLIIIAERDQGKTADGDAAAEEAIRSAVSANHGAVARHVVLVEPGVVPRTSSGKIARSLAKKVYLADRIAGASKQQSFPDSDGDDGAQH